MISPFLNRPGAMRADKLRQVISLARANSGAFNLLAGETTGKKKKEKAALQHETINGKTAVIEASGILVKNLSPLSLLIGEVSMIEIGQVFQAAIDDPQITAVVLRIDSPGGTVDGTEQLAATIYSARDKKPIISFCDGQLCSAAYWIGAAANAVYISGQTVQAGSIGVVAMHVDVSEQDKMYGEKYTEITAGKYKRIASNHRPLSDEGRDYLQEQVDYLYAVFVESIAKYRGLSIPQVLGAADGKIFIGQDSVERGLVDGVMSFEQVLALAGSPEKIKSGNAKTGTQARTFEQHVYALCRSGKSQQEAFQSIKTMHPPLYADFERRLRAGAVSELFPNQAIGGTMQH